MLIPVVLEPIPIYDRLYPELYTARAAPVAFPSPTPSRISHQLIADLQGLWAGDYGPHGEEVISIRILTSHCSSSWGKPIEYPRESGSAATVDMAVSDPVDNSLSQLHWRAQIAAPCSADQLRLAPHASPADVFDASIAKTLIASGFSRATPLGAGAADLLPWHLLTDMETWTVIVGTKVTGDRNVPSGQVSFVACYSFDDVANTILNDAGKSTSLPRPIVGAELLALLETSRPIRMNSHGLEDVTPAELCIDMA